MIKGFVFGKFMPFHKGHEAMMRFAATQCDRLSVLVCKSDREAMSGDLRKKWIESALSDLPEVNVTVFEYSEEEHPNTSVSSSEVSKKWSEVFMRFFPDHHLVVTSEPYGQFVAREMNIRHVAFDYDRLETTISASEIRNDIFKYWGFLPCAVKEDHAIKVVILGTESTGKSTLSLRLAEHYQCSLVEETGRDLIPSSTCFSIDDLRIVAQEHAGRIKRTSTAHSPLLIIDTDIHITQSYCKFAFGQELEVDAEIYSVNKADLYLYLCNDVEFMQDGTRMSELDRDKLDLSHRETLRDHGVEFEEVAGDWQSRFERAVRSIDELLKSKTMKV